VVMPIAILATNVQRVSAANPRRQVDDPQARKKRGRCGADWSSAIPQQWPARDLHSLYPPLRPDIAAQPEI
jgi:hypothetical protein